jgi:hypothetical protein
VDNGANLLVPVPGGADGPGGLLVCAENFVIYRNQARPPPPVRQGGAQGRGAARPASGEAAPQSIRRSTGPRGPADVCRERALFSAGLPARAGTCTTRRSRAWVQRRGARRVRASVSYAHRQIQPHLQQRVLRPCGSTPTFGGLEPRGARAQDHPDVRAVIPRRSALPVDRGVLIVAHVTHKQKALFFFLVQARPRARVPRPLRGSRRRAPAWRSSSGRVGARPPSATAPPPVRACRAAAARGVRRAALARSARRWGAVTARGVG